MKRWICILVPVLILGSLIGWRLNQKHSADAAMAGQRSARSGAAPVVAVSEVAVHDIVQTFDATGNIEAPLNVKIAPKVSGRIDVLDLREGDRVRKGQVLVRIDPSDVEAGVQQQRAALAEAQYRLAQAQMTENPTNVSINTQIRQQKASVSSATADYNQVRQNYEAQMAAAAASVSDAQSKVENAKAGVQSAEANLENTTAKLNRITSLYKQGFVAAQEVDDAKASVKVQQSALDITRGLVNSALAQKNAIEQQERIVKTKGKADIEAARAKVEQAKASLEYANANTAQKSAYKQSIAALRSAVAVAKASLKSAESKRADTILVSPLDGFVTGRYADPGAMAMAGQPIISVQFMRQVWVTLAVPEEVCAKVHIGQPATVKVDALPGRSFTGSVVQINPSADAANRQFVVRVIMSNAENLFKPGMYARVSIETDRVAKAGAVPREAVQTDKDGKYVIVATSGGEAKRCSVVTGPEDSNFIAIEQGVNLGEKVVTMSAFPIRDDQKLRIGGKKGGKNGHSGRPGGER